jgi:ribosome-binding protein aMBF1 (putative translation factor)
VNPAHLFTGSHADNHADREAKGRGGQWMTRGESHVNHKLTDGMVRTIRQWASEGISQSQLAREFGVSNQLISKIVRRKAWAHVQ